MPKRIPVKAAKDFAQQQGCSQVIITAWDGERTHVVTYGKTKADCEQAAQGGNLIKKALSWPDGSFQLPARVRFVASTLERLYRAVTSKFPQPVMWSADPDQNREMFAAMAQAKRQIKDGFVESGWRTDNPPECGYYLATHGTPGNRVVSELWYRGDSWWTGRGYLGAYENHQSKISVNDVVAWQHLPATWGGPR